MCLYDLCFYSDKYSTFIWLVIFDFVTLEKHIAACFSCTLITSINNVTIIAYACTKPGLVIITKLVRTYGYTGGLNFAFSVVSKMIFGYQLVQ